MKIELITTPNEQLKESGFGNIKSCINILESLSRLGHHIKLNICETKKELEMIIERKPDLVILAVKYILTNRTDKIWLSEYFDTYGINYTASSSKALKFDSDKVFAKQYLKLRGIKTANYFTAIPNQFIFAKDLPISFPLFLKPTDAANGNGIDDLSFVTNFEEFQNKVKSLYEIYKHPILVEEYLDGKEFTISIIETINGKLIVSAIEILPLVSSNGLRILGAKAKKDNLEELRKINDKAIKTKLIKLASKIFKELGARDYGRIDIKTNKKGECFFMEANLVPGMARGSSYFPKACEIDNNLTYDNVVNLMIETGLNRINSFRIKNKKLRLINIDNLVNISSQDITDIKI